MNSCTPDELDWGGRVWRSLSRIQCAGVLHIALAYPERQRESNAFVESASTLQWTDLGHTLQADITVALQKLKLAVLLR